MKSQLIIGDGATKVVKGSGKGLEFIIISLWIWETRERGIIKLRLKVENTESFIILKIIFDAVPSIKGTILKENNSLKKSATNSTINSYANNIIKTLPFVSTWRSKKELRCHTQRSVQT